MGLVQQWEAGEGLAASGSAGWTGRDSAPVKILQVTTDTNYGGVQEVVLAICRNASPGFQHFVLRIGAGKLEEAFRQNATVLNAGGSFESSIRDAIRTTGADIVHVHLPGGTCPPWLLTAAETGVPIVESIHCAFRALVREEEIAAARVVASEHAAGLQRTRDKLHVIPHPISGDGLSKALRPEQKARRRQERSSLLGIPDTGIAIGRLGNITPWKRVQDFIAVVPLVLAWTQGCSRPLSFSIAGSSHDTPSLMEELREFAGRLGVKDKIFFAGDLPDKYAFLSMLDVFLYPTSKETYCIAAAEAMAMGCLVISYRESAMPETVGDGGILVEPGNYKALAEAVASYVRNPDPWMEKRSLASRTALARNAPDIVIPKYEKIYAEVAR
jgi:glycosyltransferase involved in cell wall biosynthesis